MPSATPPHRVVAGLKQTARTLAARRSFPLIVAALAVFLALPALRAGWMLDDYYHRVVMDRRPAVVTFRFDQPLESPSLVWLCYRGRGFEPFILPPMGRSITIRLGRWAVFKLPIFGPASE
jgi:hypothetical protein